MRTFVFAIAVLALLDGAVAGQTPSQPTTSRSEPRETEVERLRTRLVAVTAELERVRRERAGVRDVDPESQRRELADVERRRDDERAAIQRIAEQERIDPIRVRVHMARIAKLEQRRQSLRRELGLLPAEAERRQAQTRELDEAIAALARQAEELGAQIQRIENRPPPGPTNPLAARPERLPDTFAVGRRFELGLWASAELDCDRRDETIDVDYHTIAITYTLRARTIPGSDGLARSVRRTIERVDARIAELERRLPITPTLEDRLWLGKEMEQLPDVRVRLSAAARVAEQLRILVPEPDVARRVTFAGATIVRREKRGRRRETRLNGTVAEGGLGRWATMPPEILVGAVTPSEIRVARGLRVPGGPLRDELLGVRAQIRRLTRHLRATGDQRTGGIFAMSWNTAALRGLPLFWKEGDEVVVARDAAWLASAQLGTPEFYGYPALDYIGTEPAAGSASERAFHNSLDLKVSGGDHVRTHSGFTVVSRWVSGATGQATATFPYRGRHVIVLEWRLKHLHRDG